MCEYRFRQVEKLLEYYEKVSITVIHPKMFPYFIEDPKRLQEIATRHVLLKKDILDATDLTVDSKAVFLDSLDTSLNHIEKVLAYQRNGDERALEALIKGGIAGAAIALYTEQQIKQLTERAMDNASKKTIEELRKIERIKEEGDNHG